ncbi:MAG: glycosyltransferase [archaeon]|nr:glycosyltransferase [archaeon]
MAISCGETIAGKVIFLSTFPPRECGIATFTRDLSDAMQKKFGGEIDNRVIAMEEGPEVFRVYNGKVLARINEASTESYDRVAKKLNSMKSAKILNVQHEFGIFGGEFGSNLLPFLEKVDKKIVTTMHTVLDNPEPAMKSTVKSISELSDGIVVMTDVAKRILIEDYAIAREKVTVIPHGVPNMAFGSSKERVKKKFGLEKNRVLLTFGLLSRGKSIERVVRAMPMILASHPDAVYLIVGETHPKVREHEGESYRNELRALSKKLGVENSVKFMDKYLSIEEIIEALKMADVYVAPSLDPQQVCSGTVSYAMSAGKAIVASPNKYNLEVLGDGRGLISHKNSPLEFAENISRLLSDVPLKRGLERASFEYSRKMVWHNVSTLYYETFSSLDDLGADSFGKLPRINFKHLYRMTDDFGIIQFADFSTPLKESGYTLDDNARALIVAVKSYAMNPSAKMLSLADTYLGFVEKAALGNGYFHNEFGINREPLDERGSEDSMGRTIHSLGMVLQSPLPQSYKDRAKKILEVTLGPGFVVESPRAQADSLLGLVRARGVAEFSDELIHVALDSLVSKFDANSTDSWKWFETYLTYGNSVIPEALFDACVVDSSGRASEVAVCSMDFLTQTHFINDKLVPVGQRDWYVMDKVRSFYDQQPIEAASLTTAYVKAYNSTKNPDYLSHAKKSFDWFLGRNSVSQMVYNDATGGCFDGITLSGVNANQGAESTVTYLNARLDLYAAIGK